MDQVFPYWVIRDTVAQMIDTMTKSPIETEITESGTSYKFMGLAIGNNLSVEEIAAHKRSIEVPLQDAYCEIVFYESCLLNLPRDNYENIRNIFKEMRRNIQNAKTKNK